MLTGMEKKRGVPLGPGSGTSENLVTPGFVNRGGDRFKLRVADSVVKTTNFVYEDVVVPQMRSKGLFACCSPNLPRGHRYSAIGSRRAAQLADVPDVDFYADTLVKLSNGITAYRLTEPSTTTVPPEQLPLVVCLHDLTTSSYVWADVVDLLADCEQGPKARTLVFDFYGRGRSPWIGVPCTLDVLVQQVKELLDFLKLSNVPIQLIGHGMGGLIATGFCAKYPSVVTALTLLAPMGLGYMPIPNIKFLRIPVISNFFWFKKRNIKQEGEAFFFDLSEETPHRYLIDKQIAMAQWQMENTPGYMEAVLSSLLVLPLASTEELYAAVGRHPRPVLVLWGDQDTVTPYAAGVLSMRACFERGTIVDVRYAGHNILAENFNDTMNEILAFSKEVVGFSVGEGKDQDF